MFQMMIGNVEQMILKCTIGRWTLYDNGIMHVLFTNAVYVDKGVPII